MIVHGGKPVKKITMKEYLGKKNNNQKNLISARE